MNTHLEVTFFINFIEAVDLEILPFFLDVSSGTFSLKII